MLRGTLPLLPLLRLSLALGLMAGAVTAVAAPVESVPPSTIQALQWRLIGPFSGGRTTAVAGHPSQPSTFYLGATGGGVWRTTDSGTSWRNITDGYLRTNTIGAIAVAPSDANLIYVGTGEAPIRGVAAASGDGLYKSADGGRTWANVGLVDGKQISRVIIHPSRPDILFVAVQGNPWGASDTRGVYKSIDGGMTWNKVLFVDRSTGASDLSMDAHNSDVLYAAMWDHQRSPWAIRSGGPGSGIWKSTDGGQHWKRLTQGLPGLMGKIGVAVSPADSRRVYAVIEATAGGVYRSDDAGDTWARVNDDQGPRDRGWYYSHITADPQNKDQVYLMAAPFVVSNDGGKTFRIIQNAHGDNHALWINPEHPQIMIEGNDGGAAVTLNGGRTWSSEMNQPTGQFYRIETDFLWPYHIYAAQQDRSSVRIASRSLHGGISEEDWHAIGGGESSYFGFDREHPRLIYGSAGLGEATEYDSETGVSRKIDPYPMFAGFRQAKELKYRANWNAPIRVSQQHPDSLYWGSQKLLRSTDRGLSWVEISPDLTRARPQTLGTTGYPIMIEGAGGEHYATLSDFVISPHDDRVIWSGSDDGMVHITRDGGKTWQDVTPKGLPEGLVNSIEVSPNDPATAYFAFNRYKLDDDAPYAFKTSDYGQTWTPIVAGLPTGHFVEAVREDPKRRGLLYLATDDTVFVSFSGGSDWQSLKLNLPAVPVNDLQVHEDDLVAVTQGRAIWVLDGLAPLRQVTSAIAAQSVHLYTPEPVLRLEGGGRAEGAEGANPTNGAVFYYYLSAPPAGDAVLEVIDAGGHVVQHFSSKSPSVGDMSTTVKGQQSQPPSPPLPVKPGMNRYTWDLRREAFTPTSDTIRFVSFRPPRIGPGNYTIRLTVDGKTSENPLQVLPQPGSISASPAQWAEQQATTTQLYELVNEDHALSNAIRATEAKLRAAHSQPALIARMEAWEKQVPQPPLPDGAIDKIGFPSGLLSTQILQTLSVADGPAPISAGVRTRTAELAAQWSAMKSDGDRLLAAAGHWAAKVGEATPNGAGMRVDDDDHEDY